MVDGFPFANWFSGDDFELYQHPEPIHDCFVDGNPPPPTEKIDVAVVGGRISGFTSAWMLRKHDPVLFELHDRFGGAA